MTARPGGLRDRVAGSGPHPPSPDAKEREPLGKDGASLRTCGSYGLFSALRWESALLVSVRAHLSRRCLKTSDPSRPFPRAGSLPTSPRSYRVPFPRAGSLPASPRSYRVPTMGLSELTGSL